VLWQYSSLGGSISEAGWKGELLKVRLKTLVLTIGMQVIGMDLGGKESELKERGKG
jgi:hypothetical protein